MAKVKTINVANGSEQYFEKSDFEKVQKNPKFRGLFKVIEAPEPPEVTKLKEQKKQQESKKDNPKQTDSKK